MKNRVRRTLFFLLALALLCLSACGGSNLKIPEETAEETAAPAEKPARTFTVGKPYTRADLSAIPIASNTMTEEELRSICLSFARMQGTIPWIASDNIKYPLETTTSDANGNMNFKNGVVYGGLPYTSAGSNLYTFFDYYDEETGLLDPAVYKRVGASIGNNCCTALFWAWSRVSSSITFTITQNMTPTRGIVPLGDYRIDRSLSSYKNYTTYKICHDNGEQTMYESYALLKLADGVVMNNQGDPDLKGNHTMMCSILPEVVRNADGTIDGDKSFVHVVEQHEVLRDITLENGLQVRCEAGINTKFTFRALYNKGYVPFSIPEILDPSTVQKAAVAFPVEEGGTLTLAQWQESAMTANYAFSRMDVTLTGENGAVYDFTFYTKGVAQFTWDLTSTGVTMDRQIKKGSYAITVTALVGNGETLPVFSGTLVKE